MSNPFRSFQHNNDEASTPYIPSIQWRQYGSVIRETSELITLFLSTRVSCPMSPIPWSIEINFTPALLFCRCIMLLIKILRIGLRSRADSQLVGDYYSYRKGTLASRYVLGRHRAYLIPSIVSHDVEGQLAEMCFTNAGFARLAISLPSSVVMNLLSNLALNMVVAGTF
jgi:hypothetical protein